MSRLKLWVLVALVAVAGVAHLVVASRWVAARATGELDRRVGAAAAQVEAGSRLLARQVADVAHLAARDPALRAAVEPPPPPRGRRPSPPRPAAESSAAAEAAIRSAARTLGVEAARALVATLAGGRGVALQSGKRAGPEWEAAAGALLGGAAAGGTRQGHVRVDGTIYYAASVPVAGGVALAFGLPLDPAWLEGIKAATGADVTVAAGVAKPMGTLPAAEAQGLAAAVKAATAAPADVGRLGPVKLPWKVPLPPLPVLFVRAPAWRAQGVSLTGLPGALVILAAPARPLLEPLGAYQQLFGAALLLLLVAGLALSLLPPADGASRLPRELLAAADRISNGDFSARAPRLAGPLGTVSTALNRAADAASEARAAPSPSLPTPLGFPALEPPRPSRVPEPPKEDTTAREFPTGLSGRAGGLPSRGASSPPPPPPPAPQPRTGTAPFAAVGATPPPPPPAAPPVAAPAVAAPAAAPPVAPPTVAAPAAAPPTAAGGDEEHWQQVFQEFMKVRADCGEPSEGLTFDRFRTKLQKNREGLIQKYACRSVRFQVYVKDGKAALKATPVR